MLRGYLSHALLYGEGGPSPHNLSRAAAGGRAAVFHQVESFLLVAEAGLCLFCHGDERSGVLLPVADAAVVFATMLIVDDEWIDPVAQAFLDHQHPADATVAVLERMDLLKSGVEV